jgi:hypothetical protein
MTVRTLALGLLFMSATVFQSFAQKENSGIISHYLKFKEASYHWRGRGMVRKKPAPQGPGKVYDAKFIVTKDCVLKNLYASIGDRLVKGRILYNNVINDSIGVSKNGTVILEFGIPPETA